jgi:hypothetical protein
MKRLLAHLTAAIGLALAAAPANSAPPNRGIFPLVSNPYGSSYPEWSARWWQWVQGIPADVNPQFDATGANAGQNQSGPVFFLCGCVGGAFVRDVTVPAGMALFFPVVNWEQDTFDIGGNPLGLPDPLSNQDIRDIATFGIDQVSSFSCEIDGVSVRDLGGFRFQSPIFSFDFDRTLAALEGYPATHVSTAVTEGYWLMLRPLTAGQHTIHFTAAAPPFSFTLDVTYHLTVQ